MQYLLIKAQIFTGETFLSDQAVWIEDEKIKAIVSQHELPENIEIIDLQGLIIAPGFIDLQIYGGEGNLFNNEPTPETIQATYQSQLAGGTTQFQITLSTTSLETMFQAIEACQTYQQSGGKGLLGLHLEGPYFNPLKKGAHVEKYLRKPTLTELEKLVEKGKGIISYLTLATEMCNEAELYFLLNSDIRIAAGHSNATYVQATQSFGKGINHVTHLFNAMSQWQSREPGLVGATFDSEVFASIIADGIHCDFTSVKLAKKLMQERLFLITDAVTESKSGDYKFKFATDHYIDESGVLSGSALTMMQAVKNCVTKVGIDLAEALRMASLYPARAMSLENNFGRIYEDYTANLVVFDADFQVRKIVQNGETVII
jgi:N-acetylglucosamine-6-phosphate deacetylase